MQGYLKPSSTPYLQVFRLALFNSYPRWVLRADAQILCVSSACLSCCFVSLASMLLLLWSADAFVGVGDIVFGLPFNEASIDILGRRTFKSHCLPSTHV